ncbi:cytoplasmic glycerophosphodiester phosphodiesterase [compost metagenome]
MTADARFRFRRPRHAVLALALVAASAAPALADVPAAVKVVGRAASGGQPGPGYRAAAAGADGTLWLLGDRALAADPTTQPLAVQHVRPRFAATGATGAIEAVGAVALSDPDRHLDFPITHQYTAERPLTQADLDLRSIQHAPDGTLWFGDATGPFLIHTDAAGKVLEPALALPDPDRPGQFIRSADNPYYEEAASLRLMNALRAHARAHGATRDPIFAPYSFVLADHDATTVSPLRVLPGSPSSEVHDVQRLQAVGHAVIPWTVNDLPSMKALLALGVRGLISDRPDLLRLAVAGFDADGDGTPGDYLDADGLIDRRRFDAQGHRGARNLRPESTLPAFEAALDNLMTTLETDCAITRDGVPILHHDPDISPVLVRRVDNGPVGGVIHHHPLRELQARHDLGRLLPLLPSQQNDPALSPAAVAFAREHGLRGPYVWPTLQQAFRFVRFYEKYYATGPGRRHPEAARRAKNAARVHFDIETKTSPSLEATGTTPKAEAFVRAMAEVVRAEGMEDRTMIQSFDLRTLLATHQRYPRIQTMWLLGESAPFGTRPLGRSAPVATGPDTLWHQAVTWPARLTYLENPPRSPREGGIGGLAIAPDGRTLHPMLGRALVGDRPNELPILSVDLATRRFGATRGVYRLEAGNAAAPDFVLTGPDSGFVVERGGSDAVFGQVFRVGLGEPGALVKKQAVADLGRVADPDGYFVSTAAAAAGLGRSVGLPPVGGLVPFGPHRFGMLAQPSGGVSFVMLEINRAD